VRTPYTPGIHDFDADLEKIVEELDVADLLRGPALPGLREAAYARRVAGRTRAGLERVHPGRVQHVDRARTASTRRSRSHRRKVGRKFRRGVHAQRTHRACTARTRRSRSPRQSFRTCMCIKVTVEHLTSVVATGVGLIKSRPVRVVSV
jgi:hypothetical protein